MKQSWAVLVGILLGLVLMVPAMRAEDAASADGDAIKSKGLVKQGNLYVLPAEAEVTAGMRDLRLLKRKVDDDSRQRRKFEDQVKVAKNALAELEFENRQLNEQYLKEKDPTIHNQIIAKMNIVTSRSNEAIEYKNAAEEKLHGQGEGNTSAACRR